MPEASLVEFLTKHDVQTKVAFTKCKNIDRNHAVLLSTPDCFQLVAIKPVVVNKEILRFKDGPRVLKRSDSVQFPCEACDVPHLYHLIMPKDEVDSGVT